MEPRFTRVSAPATSTSSVASSRLMMGVSVRYFMCSLQQRRNKGNTLFGGAAQSPLIDPTGTFRVPTACCCCCSLLHSIFIFKSLIPWIFAFTAIQTNVPWKILIQQTTTQSYVSFPGIKNWRKWIETGKTRGITSVPDNVPSVPRRLPNFMQPIRRVYIYLAVASEEGMGCVYISHHIYVSMSIFASRHIPNSLTDFVYGIFFFFFVEVITLFTAI